MPMQSRRCFQEESTGILGKVSAGVGWGGGGVCRTQQRMLHPRPASRKLGSSSPAVFQPLRSPSDLSPQVPGHVLCLLINTPDRHAFGTMPCGQGYAASTQGSLSQERWPHRSWELRFRGDSSRGDLTLFSSLTP